MAELLRQQSRVVLKVGMLCQGDAIEKCAMRTTRATIVQARLVG